MKKLLPFLAVGILILSGLGAVAVADDDVYDMVIIAPSEFSDELQPLIDHKNSHEVETTFKSTEEIYNEYDAFDEAEEIKYFIKDAIEDWGIDYVLLVGSVDKLPIRTTWFFEEHHGDYWNETVLSDLYYADIYDEYGDFCSWDSDGDGMYGESYHGLPGVDDIVDLYPDVNIGRLACEKNNEVTTVVDKIIHYETSTYGESWYTNILLIGGDTFPGWYGNEGEMLNNMIEQIMSDFTSTKLWTSDGTFTSRAVNMELNKGVGFVDYSGHGFEKGIATHPPDDESWVSYGNLNLLGALNRHKLPIIFFDACLTAKLDFNVSELINSISVPVSRNPNPFPNALGRGPLYRMLQPLVASPEKLPLLDKLVPCFAWNWVKKDNGGAIATIGATRTAFGGFDSGAGKMSLEFFSAYESSETLGQMMTQAQIGYINDVPYDAFTVEEFILLGDPSLKIGGYEEDDNSLSIQQTSATLNNYISQTFKVLQMISKR